MSYPKENAKIDSLSIAAARCLLIDEIHSANSGHPGMALDIAPLMYTLYKYFLVADPKEPTWINRDRFVLSSGHNSPLLYAIMHMAGYPLSMDDLKAFRHLGSKTPGHPEYGWTLGVDASAGPLGMGISQAVGMAMAEKKIAGTYPEGSKIMNHMTYCLCGDGCLEEGISQEAISIAGLQKLNKLVLFYDANTSTLDGPTSNSLIEDEGMRFKASGWNVLEVKDGNDVEEIYHAIEEAKKSEDKPTLVILHTVIGYGSMNQGSHKTHGSPLGEEDIVKTKAFFGYDYPEFTVPEEVYASFRETFVSRGETAHKADMEAWQEYASSHPKEAKDFLNGFARNYEDYDLPHIELKAKESSRNASGKYIAALAKEVPFTFGGSADVAASVKTAIPGDPSFSPEHTDAKNINFGIREFAMAGIQNGILLHGGLTTYVGSFLIFSDYMKNAIRMSALEDIPAIYLLSHDSIAVGEDGPTHQPIEQLAGLRTIPNIDVIRPADERETYEAWRLALNSVDHPTCLILSRQDLPLLENSSEDGVAKGAYIVHKADGKPDYQIIATGSEVSLAIEASKILAKDGVKIEVVSMPSTNRFDRLPNDEKEAILHLPREKRIAMEMLSGDTWYKYADHVISQDEFGKSANSDDLLPYFGWTPEAIASKISAFIKR